MLELIFTIDYEIYGNGRGSLKELVWEPTDRLVKLFINHDKRLVVFAEVSELEIIEAAGADTEIGAVTRQLKSLYDSGFEIGLHLHPQWYNAQYQNGEWVLDYSEYNLCTLPRSRMVEIVDRAISYFQKILNNRDFVPTSFRAGNWLFQPTGMLAEVLSERGVKIDSSVFKGGLQHLHKLDYRRAGKNGYYWRFHEDVNISDPKGALLEIPIYTRMVPPWKMATKKRISLQQKGGTDRQTIRQKLYRILDRMRLQHPLKFDFCRMTFDELTGMLDAVIKEDRQDPDTFRPIVLIGHTKDLVDFDTVERFLDYLDEKKIKVLTFEEVYEKCV